MSFTAADQDMTSERGEDVQNMMPLTDIWNGTVNTTNLSVRTLMEIPKGYKITKLIFGKFGGQLDTGETLGIHLADEATAKTISGQSAKLANGISIEGWFSDLWVSSGTSLTCWIECQIKPIRG